MAKYYIKVVGRPFGPVESEQIIKMVADGKLTLESEVSANRLDWRPIDEVAELRQALSVGLPTAAPLGGGAPGMGGADAKVWYVTNDGVTQYGPMTQSEVLRALQTGQLLPTASAWRDGEQARPISEIPAFRARNLAPVEKKEWYYSTDGQSGYGPYAVSDILAFVEQGRANFDTLVWRQGENSRPMRNEPAFVNAYNAMHSGMATNAMPIPGGMGANNSGEGDIYGATSLFEAERRNKRIRFLYTATWIGLIVAFACAILSSCLYSFKDDDSLSQILVFVSTALFIVSVVASFFLATTSFILIYNFWKSIPIRFTRTSPSIATGLLFVPLFNLYWCFVTLVGGARDLDSAFRSYEQRGMNQNERPKYVGKSAVLTLAILYNVLFGVGIIGACYPIVYVSSLDIPSIVREMLGLNQFLEIWGYVVLCGLVFLFPLCFSGCLTGYAAATATRLLFLTSLFSDTTSDMVLWGVVFGVNLIIPFYPLFFILCVRKMKNAALQLNYWRAGSPSVQPTSRNAARVTLDDIMNS